MYLIMWENLIKEALVFYIKETFQAVKWLIFFKVKDNTQDNSQIAGQGDISLENVQIPLTAEQIQNKIKEEKNFEHFYVEILFL